MSWRPHCPNGEFQFIVSATAYAILVALPAWERGFCDVMSTPSLHYTIASSQWQAKRGSYACGV
jgi:hypothetical protein